MNIDQFIKAAQARCDAASLGPWKRDGLCIDGPCMTIYDEGGHGVEDAEFIAHARQDLPAALDIITSLRARVAELEAALEVERRMNAATRLLLPVTIYMGREHCFGTHSGYELGFAPREVIEAFNAASLAYEQAMKGKK